MSKKYSLELSDQEKIMLSRIYKLDRQLQHFITHHQNESMNKILPKTDFIKKANELYKLMNKKTIDISLTKTKYIHNLVDLDKMGKENER